MGAESIPQGPFLEARFDCVGWRPPRLSDFFCSAQASTLFGNDAPATCTIALEVD